MAFKNTKFYSAAIPFYVNIAGWNYKVSELLSDLRNLEQNKSNPYYYHLDRTSDQERLVGLKVLIVDRSKWTLKIEKGERFDEFVEYLKACISKEITKIKNTNHCIVLTAKEQPIKFIQIADDIHETGLPIGLCHRIAMDLCSTTFAVCPINHMETPEQISQFIEKLKTHGADCNGHVYCNERTA